MKKTIKAVSLLSGGLDSMLATQVILNQGIQVEGLNFYSGFFGEGTQVVTLKKHQNKEQYNTASWLAQRLNIPLHVIDITKKFKPILFNPKYGYGANLNPCLDCKTFLVKQAKEWALENGFDFLITGEVVGQRPMSQRKDTMPIVARDSGADDLLLRPLCAKNLKPTKPEIEGWVDREKLYGFSGRNRKPQMALAKEFGFEHYPTPAGGCLLTEIKYSERLRDLWKSKDEKDYSKVEIDLLKVGRHLRPRPNFKIIVGREQAENEYLSQFRSQYASLHCLNYPGPLVLVDGEINEEDLKLVSEITARFSQAKQGDDVVVKIERLNQDPVELSVSPFCNEAILDGWHI